MPVVRGATLLLVLAAAGSTLRHGVEQPGIALAFGALICVGELTHRTAGDTTGHAHAPLGTAGALAYALLGHCAGTPTTHGVLQVVAVSASALALGSAPRLLHARTPNRDTTVLTGPSTASRIHPHPRTRTRPQAHTHSPLRLSALHPRLDQPVRRVLTVAFAAVCFQPLYNSGVLENRVGQGPGLALLLLVLLALTGLCEAVLAAALTRARTGHPYGPLLRDEVRALRGVGAAVCASGVVIALAVAVAGLWALPVLCVPLLLTQLSFRRYAEVRATYRQTIASLARSTEIAGYTLPGHARRVAALAEAVGRELGLSGEQLTLLEHAALMHDIGQLSLVDPVPAGATASLPVADQRRIALLGGAVVRQTGVPAEVADVVERQADPYREQPLTARIVRTVNAYVDLSGECGGGPGGPLSALERLRAGTGHDYQSDVVESLARVLARGVALPPPG
ncbi:HD-GYP domain-containing protein [Streptomyces sp. CA-294286]|uniref:HD-GYP domain-containing protein n=1 Tax=Streptomyces sp. CA-294286 TaxID=3240070 RepID=UPI003D8B7A95